VLVFAGGLDVESGPPNQIFGDPRHPITQAFLGEAERS
jgi:ABC-type dipeptide/oligopeptide/nickel transport system ATPase component